MENQTQNPSDSLSSIPDRLTSPTPPFWKKVRNIWLVLGGAASIVLVISGGIVLPAAVIAVAKVISIVSATGICHASAACGKKPDNTVPADNTAAKS